MVPEPIEILLVEDNSGDVLLMQEALAETGIVADLRLAADGQEALDLLNGINGSFAKWRPDLILLDLNMPRMSGWEVLKAIKRAPELRCIPVVVLTTSTDEDDISAVYDLCGNCYIQKPDDFGRFVEVVRMIEQFWIKTAQLPPRI